MATTSGNLTAGTATGGQRGKGMGKKGRAAGLVATVALGLALLTGVVFGQAHHGAQVASLQGHYPYVIQGAQYPAGHAQVANSASDYGTAFDPYILQGGQARATTRDWEQQERTQVAPATSPAARPADASVAAEYRWDFGVGQPVARPADASTSAEYRWDFPAGTTGR